MNLLAFDIEATGLDPYEDRILELAVVRVEDDTLVFHAFFNPGIAIPEESTAIHGITDAAVAGCPGFASYASAVQGLVEGAVLVGFVSRRYDTLLLDTELRRAGAVGLDLATIEEIDLHRVWRDSEPRDLETAVKRFLGRRHESSHKAVPDTVVLPPLLREMARLFGYTTEDMIRVSRPDWEVDRSSRLRYDSETGEVLFNFGRHRGQPIRLNDEYLEWMLGADFPPDTKAAIKLLRRNGFAWPRGGRPDGPSDRSGEASRVRSARPPGPPSYRRAAEPAGER